MSAPANMADAPAKMSAASPMRTASSKVATPAKVSSAAAVAAASAVLGKQRSSEDANNAGHREHFRRSCEAS